ncbi:MAG: hypothetical protein SNJ64_05025 [Endomicrobiia bacterium]
MRNINFFLILIFFELFGTSTIFSLNKEIEFQLRNKLNFNESQVTSIENLVLDSLNKKLPLEPLEKLLNESISKKVSYDKLFVVLKKAIESLELARVYIDNTKTEKFFPKEKVYSISLLSELIRLGLTAEEFKTIISLLSTQNNTYEEAIIKTNYYLVLKKYFSQDKLFLEKVGVSNPAEIIFFKYMNRSVKDFSLIIKSLIRYFDTNLDRKNIYMFLYHNNNLTTKKLVYKIENFVKEDYKGELRE